MLKTLQLYTICIVTIVIVLSQISIFNNGNELNINTNSSSSQTAKNIEQSLFERIKNSKYGEPLVEITLILESISGSKKKVDKEFGDLRNLLDIEKNINDLYSFMEE